MADDDDGTVAGGEESINLEDYYQGAEKDVVGLAEGDRLKFAKQILFFLFLFSLFVIVGSATAVAWGNANKELVALVDTILDITKTVVPSTVTLVLGFYFGKTTSNAGRG